MAGAADWGGRRPGGQAAGMWGCRDGLQGLPSAPGCRLWGLRAPGRAGRVPAGCSPTWQRGWGCSAQLVPPPRCSPGGSGASVSPPRELSRCRLCPWLLGSCSRSRHSWVLRWGWEGGGWQRWLCAAGDLRMPHRRAWQHPVTRSAHTSESHEVPKAQGTAGSGHHLPIYQCPICALGTA